MPSETSLNTEEGRVVDDELNKFVSWTARLVAVHRALETEEPESIFSDPLARVFAGPKAFDYVRGVARDTPEKGSSIMMSLPPAAPGRKRRIGGGVVRPMFFDATILASCGADKPSGLAWIPEHISPGPIRQVVLLGAGLDSRPWRLGLPDGVRWYEIDLAEVLGVKQKALQAKASRACRSGSVLTFDAISAETMAEQAEQHMIKNLRDSCFKRGWGAVSPKEKFEEFMEECGWKVVQTVEMDHIALDVLQGYEYNGYPRPEGRECHYFFGIFAASPSSKA
ncbi:hypothetical protein WJX73_008029 [Symbiochloris irregularis]|uniref:S-adenosyl-L-methionine-dependent methyltransferase n=1 Tax=Symbiochloris irregularis TaxID=706552 RepID=A0AAW1NLL7_9CHLO